MTAVCWLDLCVQHVQQIHYSSSSLVHARPPAPWWYHALPWQLLVRNRVCVKDRGGESMCTLWLGVGFYRTKIKRRRSCCDLNHRDVNRAWKMGISGPNSDDVRRFFFLQAFQDNLNYENKLRTKTTEGFCHIACLNSEKLDMILIFPLCKINK